MIRSVILCTTVWCGAAQADTAKFVSFLGTQACALDLYDTERLRQSGVSSDVITSFIEDAAASGDIRMDGAWSVFSKDICTIRFPVIQSPFAIDDPLVVAATGPVDEYSAPSEITGSTFEGCYLNSDVLQEALTEYDDMTAAYLRFVGAGIVSGDLRFYNDNILETPPGFQVTKGTACASVPNILALKTSHDVLRADLDRFIREVGATVPCGDAYWPSSVDSFEVIAPFYETQTNAHFTLEISLVAMASGWIVGAGDAGRGTARPPLCTHE